MTRFSIPLLALFLGSVAVAQDQGGPQGQAGYLQIINLVSLKSSTFITLGRLRINQGDPIPTGESTGILAIKPKTHNLLVRNDAAKPKEATTPVEIQHGHNVVVICFDEMVEYKDGSKEAKLRFSLLVENPDTKGSRVSVVSLLRQPEVPAIIGKVPATLAYRKAYKVGAKLDDVLGISVAGKSVGEIEVLKPAHYIAFLYEDTETGEVSLSVIQNEKLEYQAPLPDEDEEEKEEAEKPSADTPASPSPKKPE